MPLAPFIEALRQVRGTTVLPTSLDSAALAQMDVAVRRQSMFSAQTLLENLLNQYKRDVESIIGPVQVRREDRVTSENPEGWVTEGMDPATARLRAKELLRSMSYDPGEDRGTIKDLSSDGRIDLVVSTNTQRFQGAGNFIRSNDPELVDLWPAQELYRLEPREEERPWDALPNGRWMLAAQVAGDVAAAAALNNHGRMVALKSSGIWQALGAGAGGYTDTLGNPYPPFAFRSGMWVREISRKVATELGVIAPDQVAAPAPLDIGGLLMMEDAA